MGEPVTEEMLEEWDEHADYYFGEGGETGTLATRTCALVAEVRRLKVAETERDVLRGVDCEANGDGPCGVCIKCARSKWYAERNATWIGLAEADAAGYARAERDVVAHVEAIVVRHALDRDRHRDGTDAEQAYSFRAAMCMAAAEEIAVHLKQGAHRGAAKEGT